MGEHPNSSAVSVSLAREAAEALSHRCALAIVTYPVLVFMAISMVPGASRRLAVNLTCGLVVSLLTGARFALVLTFERLYSSNPRLWVRLFRAGAYAAGLCWTVFAVHEMNAGRGGWPAWLMLMLTSGIAAGATTSLAPDPPLLRGFLLFLLGPPIFWGVTMGGPDGNAVALVGTIYLALIQAQGYHNSQLFWRSALDKEALRHAGQRRESLVNSIDGIVWESDLERSRFTFVSNRAESILGYPIKSWLGGESFWISHLHPEDRERAVQRARAETAAGRDYTVEYRMRARGGRLVCLRDIVSVTRDDVGGTALRGVMFDITSQKKSDKERKLLAHALRTVSEAVAISDLEDRILFVNDSFLRMYGYSREEILHKEIGIVRSEKNPPELGMAIAEGTRRGGWQGEVWNRHKDGREFPIALSTSLIRDEMGRTVAKIGVASDITGRKQADDELRRAKEAAEAANRAKSAFLANMSHEIRTPINGIVGMNQLLLDTPLDQRQRRYAEVVRESADSLLSILNDVLDLSRIEADKLELESTSFDLHSITEAVCDLLAVRAQEKGLELFCFIDELVPTHLVGDPGRLRQVLANLVSNAVKFTKAGEITLRVRLESPGPPVVLRFEVNDTGIGVPADKQGLLFQPFSQVDASAARRFGGSGLGLTIVRRLVVMMGGRIGFRSDEDVGSCFWFTVPFHLQSAAQSPSAASLAGKRIMIADSHVAHRDYIARLLVAKGCHPEALADVESMTARLQAADQRFDIVILDYSLHSVGPALASAGTPVVLMVPLRERRAPAFWRQLGFADTITKPVKQSELISCLVSLSESAGRAPHAGPDGSEGRRPQEARLLVVEDNETNQEVASGILEQLGYRSVEVVSDGQQALEALRRTDFDLVLMDCQMPVMDGYEATRRIRQKSTAVRNHNVPVVAMTAHALAGDRAKCLEVGMSDYITKPVSGAALDEVLRCWLAPGLADPAGPATESIPARPDGSAAPIFDRDGLLDRLMGNEELAERIVTRLVSSMSEQLGSLAEAVGRADAGDAVRIAHTLKGVAANAGAVRLSNAAAKAEKLGRSGNLESVLDVLPQLAGCSDEFRAAVNAATGSPVYEKPGAAN